LKGQKHTARATQKRLSEDQRNRLVWWSERAPIPIYFPAALSSTATLL